MASARRILRRVKTRLTGLLFSFLCIDNLSLLLLNRKQAHLFEWNPERLSWRLPIRDDDGKLKRSAKPALYHHSFSVELSCARVDPPYGFVYTKDGTLVCPPNWPMSLLINGFPMRKYLKPSEGVQRRNIEKAFYLVGPGAGNYYHWMTDRVSTIYEYFEYRRRVDSECKILCPAPQNEAFRSILHLLGIQEKDIIPCNHTRESLLVEQLIMPSASKSATDRAINNPKRIKQLRGDLLSALYREHSREMNMDSPSKLFISRRDAPKGRERLQNTAEVQHYLEEYGFSTQTLSDKSFEQQVRLFNSAEEIVAIHGAGLTNIMFCKPGTIVYEILPEGFDARYYRDLAEIFELEHRIISVALDENGYFSLDLSVIRGLEEPR